MVCESNALRSMWGAAGLRTFIEEYAVGHFLPQMKAEMQREMVNLVGHPQAVTLPSVERQRGMGGATPLPNTASSLLRVVHRAHTALLQVNNF